MLRLLSKPDKLTLAIAAISATLAQTAYAATTPTNSEVRKAREDTETIVVTGTQRKDLSHLEASSPVDIIGFEKLDSTGAHDLSSALQKLTPSFSLPSTPTGGFSSSIPVGAALRGLSADQTLVLINGKRRHQGANFTRQNYNGGRGANPVDLSLIPVAAIARVEVLRDGAAAQYGSDAIAGVINIVLKDAKEGGGISYRYSEWIRGDGEHNQINGWKGFEIGDGGSLTVSAFASDRKLANNTDPDPRPFYKPVNGQPDPREETAYRNWPFGSPETKDHYNFLANLNLPLSDTLSLYGFATYGHKTTVGLNFYDRPLTNSLLIQSPFFQQRFPDGRTPINIYKTTDYAATVGLQQDNGERGKFDFYVNYGIDQLKSFEDNQLNPSFGPDSPSYFYSGNRENAQANSALDYTLDLPVNFLSSPLTILAGVAWRWDEYELTAGDPIAHTEGPFFNPSPVIGVGVPAIYYGITDQDERAVSRNVKSVYLSFEGSPNERLDLGLALRAEDYSDFGSANTAKASLRFKFTDTLSLRSTFGNGYRAPSVVQLGYSAYSKTTPLINGVPTDVIQRTLLPTSEAARLLGGSSLKPEKSDNLSVGLVWTPLDNFSVTLDAYHIEIKDRIQLSENITWDRLAPIFSGTPYENIQNAAFFTNILDTRTRGIELTADYQLELDQYGDVNFKLGFVRNDTEVTRARDSVNANGDVIPASAIVGRSNISSIEEGIPKYKLVLSAGWNIEQWSVNVNARHYGEWVARVNNLATSATPDQTFSEQTLVDLDLGYRFSGSLEGVRINVGAHNIFESYPDYVNTRGTSVTKYSFNSPEGSLGTQYHAKVSYDF